MVRRLRALLADSRGASVIELTVALLVSAVVVAMMVTWAGAMVAAETHNASDDEATQALRVAKEELGKDIRRAEAVVTAGDRYLALLIDLDRDGEQDSGEQVSWVMSASGELLRADDAGGMRTVVEGLVYEASGFTYTSGASGIEDVYFRLVAEVTSQAGTEERSIAAEIHIRNA
jgi:type II secretory pathway component PulJ